MPSNDEPSPCLRVFISGTYEDMQDLRLRAADAISRASHAPFDSHRQPGFAQYTEDKIKSDFLDRCSFYLGIYGTRYGSRVHPDDPDSISFTEFEFDLAMERWRHRDGELLPCLIFLPHASEGDAYERISEACAAVAKLRLKTEEAIADDRRRQDNFREKVLHPVSGAALKARNRAVEFFRSTEELYDYVLLALPRYEKDLLRGRPRKLDEREAYRVRRSHQTEDAVSELLEKTQVTLQKLRNAAAAAASPGFCAVLFGGGRRVVSAVGSELAEPDLWDIDNEPELCELREESASAAEFWRAVWRAAGAKPRAFDRPDDADELAGAILAAGRPSVVVIRNLQLFHPGIDGLAEQVWKPLRKSLVKATRGRAKRSPDSSCYIVACSTGSAPAAGNAQPTSATESQPIDFEQIVLL